MDKSDKSFKELMADWLGKNTSSTNCFLLLPLRLYDAIVFVQIFYRFNRPIRIVEFCKING